MKKIIFVLALLAASQLSFSQINKSKQDTVKTVGIFMSPYDGSIVLDYMFRLYKDSAKLVQTAGDTYKKMTVRDTIYWLPTVFPLFDSATKKPLLDSLGRHRQSLQWVPTGPRNILQDFNKRF